MIVYSISEILYVFEVINGLFAYILFAVIICNIIRDKCVYLCLGCLLHLMFPFGMQQNVMYTVRIGYSAS